MPTYFPDTVTGAIVQHWDAMPFDWKQVTDDYEYQDGGKDFNEVSSVAPRRWRIEMVIPTTSHTATKALFDQYDTFFNDVRYSLPFIFTDKYGTAWSDVRIEDYDRHHEGHKSMIVFVNFTLVGSVDTEDVTGSLIDVPGGEYLIDG